MIIIAAVHPESVLILPLWILHPLGRYGVVIIIVVVLTLLLTRIIKSVVTGQASSPLCSVCMY